MSGMPQSIDSGEWTLSSCTEGRGAAVDKPRKLEVRQSARRSETSRGIDGAELGLNLTRQEYPLSLTAINAHTIRIGVQSCIREQLEGGSCLAKASITLAGGYTEGLPA